MSRARARNIVLLVVMLLATACDGRQPTSPSLPTESPVSPTPPTLTPPTPSPDVLPSPPRQSMAFEMSGHVTGDEGKPVAGAKVTIIVDVGEWYGPNPVVFTDGSGRYKVNFTGLPGSNHSPGFDPPGTEEAVGFVQVEASGYDWHFRYVLATTEHLVESIRLHRIQRITAGESAVLTVAPDHNVCGSDAWPGRELICRTMRVVAPRDGLMTIEAVPSLAGSQVPTLKVRGGDRTGRPGNPASISVIAGTEYTVSVELPWGFAEESQSFVVKTSM